MNNTVYLETYSGEKEYKESTCLRIPVESFITLCIYNYCSPENINLKLVTVTDFTEENSLNVRHDNSFSFRRTSEVPWQVASCVYPVVLCEDTVITGLCAVARHICKYRTSPLSPVEYEDGLLGFRKSCLQAPNEASIWTKFCEVDLIRTIKEVLCSETVKEIPINLVRFENHLSKPVRMHNVFKIARDMKRDAAKNSNELNTQPVTKDPSENTRIPKTRKWKSNRKEKLNVNQPTKIEDLDVVHQFAEGPFLTLSDTILLPIYNILMKTFNETIFQSLLPLTYKWFKNVWQVPEIGTIRLLLEAVETKPLELSNIAVPTTDDVSLYKCDPKRHNPKKRLFTKEDDIENALSALIEGMELNVCENEFQSGIDWSHIPDGANPSAGHLPDVRMSRKSQQLENLTLAVLNIAKDKDVIVDFCSGSGHLGILIAHLLPKCTIILLENKEQSLLRARKRVHDMGLKNVLFFQCNLDFFIGKFDIGIGLHACGVASDLVLDKCLKVNAKFVLCPCCYGSLHATDRLVYPRSSKFSNITIDQYLCIGHAADQTHEDHPLTVRGSKCMGVIDSDRARLAEEHGYTVTLSKLNPPTCTPKNNLLIGVPS